MSSVDSKTASTKTEILSGDDARAAYSPPRLEKKRALTRVTLFSGSGAAGTSGLTAL